jgi:hypothetical protein
MPLRIPSLFFCNGVTPPSQAWENPVAGVGAPGRAVVGAFLPSGFPLISMSHPPAAQLAQNRGLTRPGEIACGEHPQFHTCPISHGASYRQSRFQKGNTLCWGQFGPQSGQQIFGFFTRKICVGSRCLLLLATRASRIDTMMPNQRRREPRPVPMSSFQMSSTLIFGAKLARSLTTRPQP